MAEVADAHEQWTHDQARGADNEARPARRVIHGNASLSKDNAGERVLFVCLTPIVLLRANHNERQRARRSQRTPTARSSAATFVSVRGSLLKVRPRAAASERPLEWPCIPMCFARTTTARNQLSRCAPKRFARQPLRLPPLETEARSNSCIPIRTSPDLRCCEPACR